MSDDGEQQGGRDTFKYPNGLFNFSDQTVRVIDADEEIMELYMNLASSAVDDTPDTGGLGFLDPLKQCLDIEIVLCAPVHDVAGEVRKKRGERTKAKGRELEIVRRVKVVQDLESLKGRKGDTGSVLWRSSLYLAQNILQSAYFPPVQVLPLLDPHALAQARVLELGAGTGLLATLLSPLVGSYTASDLLENLKLVKKNLDVNGIRYGGDKATEKGKGKVGSGGEGAKVRIEEIDWVDVSQRRSRGLSKDGNEGDYDLILAVDCIYNEYLIKPLVDTFEKYCPRGGKGVVWVVCELRSSDVMTTFIETWLAEDDWVIIRLGGDEMSDWQGRKPRWVGWIGWRS